jgi:uncharacterized membrane protein
MSKIGFSKTDNRKAVMALAVVAMFLATMGVSNVNAASPVSIAADQTTFDIMVGGTITTVLTITSQDSVYKKMNLFLDVSWPSGEEWDTSLTDSNYDSLSNDQVTLTKGGSATVLLTVSCGSDCDAGETNTVQVTGQSDPKFYVGSTNSNCGSSNCLTDTTPASSSSNTTNTITITLTARTGFSHVVACDTEHNGGDINVYQGINYFWPYTLTNTGWDTDNYQFTSTVTSESGADVTGWSVTPGLSNGKELTGSDSSLTGISEVEALIEIAPALTARPGTYNIDLVVSSNGGGPSDNCVIEVIVPAPDLEIKVSDIDFSHTSAWISTRGDSQKVTIYATVRNNGGNIDSDGVNTNDVTVKFYADSAPIGTSQTVSLKHGDEETLSVDWNPSRAHTSDEVGLVITVKVDPASDIGESDESNNDATSYFKVVRTKSSTPSFFMGFFALIGSVAVAVMLSSYYRNKDSEE